MLDVPALNTDVAYAVKLSMSVDAFRVNLGAPEGKLGGKFGTPPVVKHKLAQAIAMRWGTRLQGTC